MKPVCAAHHPNATLSIEVSRAMRTLWYTYNAGRAKQNAIFLVPDDVGRALANEYAEARLLVACAPGWGEPVHWMRTPVYSADVPDIMICFRLPKPKTPKPNAAEMADAMEELANKLRTLDELDNTLRILEETPE